MTDKTTKKFQIAGISENYEDVDGGSPTTMQLRFTDSMVNSFSPGDRLAVIGILASEKVPQKSGKVVLSHVIHVLNAYREDMVRVEITEMDRKRIHDFASVPHVLARLSQMYAPEVIGHEIVKRAIVLQGVGGVPKFTSSGRQRGVIHILLVGDPGLGKSQLLRANSTLAPKSLYVSDASGAGLTAAVVEIGGARVMSAGVLVLANGGIACIDELDKMQKEDRDHIHTAMEQGVIAKSKAGIYAQFKTDTAILAAGNPRFERFDPAEELINQVDLGAAILNRFDAIFFFVDKPGDRVAEEERAVQILSPKRVEKDDFLLKYATVARQISPSMPDEIAKKIAQYYSNLRTRSNVGVTVNPRTLEAMRRFSEASAKLRLSPVVMEEDYQTAVDIMESFMKQFNYDLDAINTGISSSSRGVIKWVENVLRTKGNMSAHLSELLAEGGNVGIDSSKLDDAIGIMKRNGALYSPNDGSVRLVI
jgi:replicative DNA helicase Mcm